MWVFILSGVMGVFSILQNGINRRLATSAGLAKTIVINNIILLVSGIIFYILVSKNILTVPDLFKDKKEFTFHWSFLIPGLLGLSIILILPFSISSIGAAQTFIAFLGIQIIASFIWDIFVEKASLSISQIISGVFILIGIVLSQYKN